MEGDIFRFKWLPVAALIVGSVIGSIGVRAQEPAPHPDVVIDEQQTQDTIVIHLTNGLLRIKPCKGDIARVTYVSGSTIPDLSNPAIADSACVAAPFSVHEAPGEIEVAASGLHVRINRNSRAVRFSDAQDRSMLGRDGLALPANRHRHSYGRAAGT